jgi:hypothetical protein
LASGSHLAEGEDGVVLHGKVLVIFGGVDQGRHGFARDRAGFHQGGRGAHAHVVVRVLQQLKQFRDGVRPHAAEKQGRVGRRQGVRASHQVDERRDGLGAELGEGVGGGVRRRLRAGHERPGQRRGGALGLAAHARQQFQGPLSSREIVILNGVDDDGRDRVGLPVQVPDGFGRPDAQQRVGVLEQGGKRRRGLPGARPDVQQQVGRLSPRVRVGAAEYVQQRGRHGRVPRVGPQQGGGGREAHRHVVVLEAAGQRWQRALGGRPEAAEHGGALAADAGVVAAQAVGQSRHGVGADLLQRRGGRLPDAGVGVGRGRGQQGGGGRLGVGADLGQRLGRQQARGARPAAQRLNQHGRRRLALAADAPHGDGGPHADRPGVIRESRRQRRQRRPGRRTDVGEHGDAFLAGQRVGVVEAGHPEVKRLALVERRVGAAGQARRGEHAEDAELVHHPSPRQAPGPGPRPNGGRPPTRASIPPAAAAATRITRRATP